MTVNESDRERIFACDFCMPTSARQLCRPLTNPCEWIRSKESTELLRLCGVEETRIGPKASDYDFLAALCEVLPWLAGHPVEKRFCFLTNAVLGVDPRATEPAVLWRRGGERLLEACLTPSLLLERLGETFGCLASLREPIPTIGEAVLSAETLADAVVEDKPTDWSAWEKNADARLVPWVAHCRAVRIVLPSGYRYRRSSRYSADCFLTARERSDEAQDMWLSQQLRFWARWAATHRIPWLLYAEGAGAEAIRLLEETERAVGLPRVVWLAEDAETCEAMIAFAKRTHALPIDRALPLLRYPSDDELRRAMERAAARTPLGRLLAVTGGEWQAIPYERERYLSLLASF